MKFAYCGYDFFWKVLDTLVASEHELLSLFSYNADGKYDFNTNVFRIATTKKCPIKITSLSLDDAKILKENGCELLVCAAYPYKIPTEALSMFKYAINIHPSMLPEGRGPWPIPWVILKGLNRTGVTIQKLNQAWDSGEILLQEEILVDNSDNLESLSAKMQLLATKLIAEFIERPDYFVNNSRPQSDGSYWGWPNKEDRTINWNTSIDNISRVVRAFSKFEAYGWIEDLRHYIRDITVWKATHNYTPGTVVHQMNKEVIIAAKDGLVCVRNYELAPEKGVKP